MSCYRPVAILIVTICCLCLVVIGCGGDHTTAPAAPVAPITGPTRTITVKSAAGEVITDGVSGLSFSFPNGGDGTLTLAPIINAPARPLSGGTGYQMAFSQDVPVTLRVAIPVSGEHMLYVYHEAVGCYDGITRPEKDWVALPARNPGDGYLYYDLVPGTGRGRQSLNEIIDYFWSVTVDPPANAQTIRQWVTDAERACVTALPEPLQAGVVQREAERGGTVYFRDPGLGSFYFYTSTFGASIYLRTDIDQITTVHETAHYMTHMLMSDDAWANLQRNTPQTHAIGDIFSRTSALTEDYAYYLQSVMGYSSVSVTNAATLCGSTMLPSKVDLPSVEGFAATLLGYLTIADSPHVDFTRTQSQLPAVGLTPGQAVMPFRNGPLNITELYPQIEQYLIQQGYPPAALSVIAERAGWSYHGTGRVLEGGQPVFGATVQALIRYEKDGLTQTYTTPAAITDIQGRYDLPRLFPGSMNLQVTYRGATTTVPYTINRTDPTTTVRAIADIMFNAHPQLDPLSPDYAKPGDTIRLTGANFGATQPTNAAVIATTLYYNVEQTALPIISWSDTAITVMIPADVLETPTSLLVRTGPADTQCSNVIWFYVGDGQRYLQRMKTYMSVELCVQTPGTPILIDSEAGLAATWQQHTRSLTWDGNTFTARMTGSRTIDGVTTAKEATITGELDPIHWRLVRARGQYRYTTTGSSASDSIREEDITIVGLSGGPDFATGPFFFGRKENAYVEPQPTLSNIESFTYIVNGIPYTKNDINVLTACYLYWKP